MSGDTPLHACCHYVPCSAFFSLIPDLDPSQVADVTYVDGRPVPLVTPDDMRVLATAMDALRAQAPAIHSRCSTLHTRGVALGRASSDSEEDVVLPRVASAPASTDRALVAAVSASLEAGSKALRGHVQDFATSPLVTRALSSVAAQLDVARQGLVALQEVRDTPLSACSTSLARLC